MGVTYSYAQVDEASKEVAAWIQNLGLKKGSVIAIILPNAHQYLPIVIGTMRAGLVITLVNPLYTHRELKHQLNDSDCKAIFILYRYSLYTATKSIIKNLYIHLETSRIIKKRYPYL
jgi:acyl-CoA synthetase (AMP-forming)/AMP-acid ligase II